MCMRHYNIIKSKSYKTKDRFGSVTLVDFKRTV